MLKVAVDKITPRICYVFDIIRLFRRVDFQPVLIEYLKEEEQAYFYSQELSVENKGLKASVLLYEDAWRVPGLTKGMFEGEECLAFEGVADPLAAIFYHLTRMEEYNYTNYDKHGRFQFKDSFVNQFNWETKLMTERWIDIFLKDVFFQLQIFPITVEASLKLRLTFDIDNTFAFKWKPASRILGSYFKDLMRLDFKRIAVKTQTLLGCRKDPYDTFDKIKSFQMNGIDVQLFWLLGDFGAFDRNVPNTSKKHLNFIRQLGKELNIGLHPSYASNTNSERLSNEKQLLEKVLGRPVDKSRQHFLKLQFPFTYQRNMEAGLKADYTLGFGDALGFRAGTLRCYPFFDISENKQYDVWIYPFVYMDGTLREYLRFSLEESKRALLPLIEEAKRFGGDFISIWHNETISDWSDWKGWVELIDFTQRNIYETDN